jgi:hypothetical protein
MFLRLKRESNMLHDTNYIHRSFHRFMYCLYIMMDANFCLKNRAHANDRLDVRLNPGWSHFVNEEPFEKYLKTCTYTEDVSANSICTPSTIYLETTLRSRLAPVLQQLCLLTQSWFAVTGQLASWESHVATSFGVLHV